EVRLAPGQEDDEVARPGGALVGQHRHAGAAGVGEDRLAQGEHHDHGEQDRDEDDGEGKAHGRRWNAARWDCSLACIAAVWSGSAWSWPSTCRMPCTTRRATSSSSVPSCWGWPACSAAWAAATEGHTTTSPSSTGTSSMSSGGRSGPLVPLS